MRKLPEEDRRWDTVPIYTTVMGSLNVAKEFKLVLQVFQMMEKDGVDPSGTGYGLAISAAGRQRYRRDMAQEALRLLVEAHELREELTPPVDTRAYLSVITSYERENEPLGACLALKLSIEADQVDERCFEGTLQVSRLQFWAPNGPFPALWSLSFVGGGPQWSQ